MAKLIFELTRRGQPDYYKLSALPVRIGRAFDNDIIVADPTVSPYHIVIKQKDDNNNNHVVIHNLSTENTTRLNKERLDNTPRSISLSSPVKLHFGHSHGRLLTDDTAIEKTHVRRCKASFCLLDNMLWSICLLLITVATIFWQSYLATHYNETVLHYVLLLKNTVLIMIGIALVLAGISRLVSHRWEIAASISLSSLIFLIPTLFDILGHFLDYFFTSHIWENIFSYTTYIILIPFLFSIFLVKIHHVKTLQAVSVAFLLCSPLIAYHASGMVDKLSNINRFSDQPNYHNLLSSKDMRLQETQGIDNFFQQAEKDIEQKLVIEQDTND